MLYDFSKKLLTKGMSLKFSCLQIYIPIHVKIVICTKLRNSDNTNITM